MSETVAVDRAQLDELVASVQELAERVGNLLDMIAAPGPPAEPDPAAPLPGFTRWRNRQGGQRD